MAEPDLEPFLRYWRAHDALFDRVLPTWWGAVVSDARYPRVQEPNYARVETAERVRLADVETALLPAIAGGGSRQAHVVVFRPEEQTDLVVQASTRGETVVWDLAMEHPGDGVDDEPPDPRVEEVTTFDAGFWAAHRASLRWFDVSDDGVLDELQGIERDLLVPAGRRWFAVRQAGAFAAFAALLVLDGLGYVDHVVTFPAARRRGFASALARRAVAEAAGSGADRTFLLAELGGAAVGMYERIGFRPLTTIASWVSPIEGGTAGARQPGGAGR